MEFFFPFLWKSLILTGNFMYLRSSLFTKSLSAFVILLGLWFAGFKHLTKNHLKHSLSSVFWILIKPSLGWSNSSGNFTELLPVNGLYFGILMLWSMTESIIQPEPFAKDFSMFDITVV